MKWRVIAALGDSITNGYFDTTGRGWYGRLCDKIAEKYPLQYMFHNLSESGDRSYNILSRLSTEVGTRSIDVLFILTGVNDSARKVSVTEPVSVFPELSDETWWEILDKAKRLVSHVIVLSILPVDEETFPMKGSFDKDTFWKNSDISAYNAMLAKQCKEFSVPLIDAASAWQGEKMADVLYDGLHPNDKGHQLVADLVFEELTKLGLFEEK